jgi:bacterioferritin-associated ferredoxin
VVICHCRAVNDQTIRATVLAGARDVDDIASRCGAGGHCGSCVPAVLAVLDEHLATVDLRSRISAA